MNIQERVLNALKPVIASRGFGEKTVEGLATNLSAGLSEESTDEDISKAIEGASSYFALMQSENNRFVNEYKKKNPSQVDPENPNPTTTSTTNPVQQSTEPTALDAKFAELAAKVDQLLNHNNALSLQQKWQKLAEANGISNEVLIKKWQPSKEDEFDSAIEELKEFSSAFVKQVSNGQSPGRPRSGDPVEGGPRDPKALTAQGKKALEGFKKANERLAKQKS